MPPRLIISTLCLLASSVMPACLKLDETTREFWLKAGQQDLFGSLLRHQEIGEAKGVILFVAGGLGTSFVSQARRYSVTKNPGFKQYAFETFPYVGLHMSQSQDEASTANSYLTGVLNQADTVGVGPTVRKNDCEASLQDPTQSLADWFLSKDKSVGFVTNARVSYASVAPLYAHAANADWEASVDGQPCRDITYQLLHRFPGKELSVILGGGRSNFYPNYLRDPLVRNLKGNRLDARRLAAEWVFREGRRKYVMTTQELKALDYNQTDHVLGLFNPSHLDYLEDRGQNSTQPTMLEMIQSALTILTRNKNGFFLLVDSPRIGHALAEKMPKKAFEELEDFNRAIAYACKVTNREDTLIVVTGTNSPSFLLRKKDVKPRASDPQSAKKKQELGRRLLFRDRLAARRRNNLNNLGRNSKAGKGISVARQGADSGEVCAEARGEDIPVYASGPMSHLFTSTYETNGLAHFLACAGLVGPSRGACKGFIDRTSKCYR